MIFGRLLIAGTAAGMAAGFALALGWAPLLCLFIFVAVYTLGIFLV